MHARVTTSKITAQTYNSARLQALKVTKTMSGFNVFTGTLLVLADYGRVSFGNHSGYVIHGMGTFHK